MPRPLLPTLAVATTLVLWASAFVGIRHLGHTFSPGSLTLGRVAVASVALGIGVLLTGWVRPTRDQWLRLIAIGVLWFGIYNLALNEGEQRIDAGTAALLIQLSPILVAALSVVVLKERLGPWLVLGIVIAFGGVAMIAFAHSPSGDRDLVGVGLCIVSAVVYAIALVLQKPLMARLSALQVTWTACTVAVIATLPWAGHLLEESRAASAADIGWLVYLGLFPTAIAFTTYAFALKHMSASSLGVTTYLVPPITVVMSWLLLDEVPTLVVYAGGALCLVGVSLSRRGARAARPPVAEVPQRLPDSQSTPRD